MNYIRIWDSYSINKKEDGKYLIESEYILDSNMKDKFLELGERQKQFGVIYGEFDHLNVSEVTLSNVSHIIEKIEITDLRLLFENLPQNYIRVIITSKILNTPNGRMMQNLIDDYIVFKSALRCLANLDFIEKIFTIDFYNDCPPEIKTERKSKLIQIYENIEKYN